MLYILMCVFKSMVNLKIALNSLWFMVFGCNTCELIMLLWEDIGPACVVHTVLVVCLAVKERTQQVIF